MNVFDTLRYQISIGDHDYSASAASSRRRRGGSLVSSPSRLSFAKSLTEAHGECTEPGDCASMEADLLIADEQRIKVERSLVVLSFQYKIGEVVANRWLEDYNARSGRNLKWLSVLPNNLHMVEIDEENPESVLKLLLDESPLESVGIFAAVNRFHSSFLSEKPKFLRQIVTVLISNQALFNQLIFNLADLVLAPVGKVVGKRFRKNKNGTRIEAVVETCRDTFVTQIEVPLLDTQTLLLDLCYVGLTSDNTSRSLLGKAKDCLNLLKPKKGLEPTPPCGNLSCFTTEKACLSID